MTFRDPRMSGKVLAWVFGERNLRCIDETFGVVVSSHGDGRRTGRRRGTKESPAVVPAPFWEKRTPRGVERAGRGRRPESPRTSAGSPTAGNQWCFSTSLDGERPSWCNTRKGTWKRLGAVPCLVEQSKVPFLGEPGERLTSTSSRWLRSPKSPRRPRRNDFFRRLMCGSYGSCSCQNTLCTAQNDLPSSAMKMIS